MAIIQPLLSVRDVQASLAFYTEYLGFTHDGTVLPGKDDKPVFAGVTHGPTTLYLDNTEYADLPPGAPLGVGVDLFVSLDGHIDIDALYTRLREGQVTIVQELKEEFWGDKRFVIQDPDGYRLSIAQTVRSVSMDEMAEVTRQG
jgi:uncharacterized glyoxalase superfamily protein PhnB